MSDCQDCNYPVTELSDSCVDQPKSLRFEIAGVSAIYDWNAGTNQYERRMDDLPSAIGVDGMPVSECPITVATATKE